ncbi:MAG TPA: DNA polymerase III subunit delta [Chloroflexi bacterium]|nr:DNA polymerase III subunit delta [Chloroflexota bacterium]
MLHIFHGENELLQAEAVTALLRRTLPPEAADFNTARFKGAVAFDEVRRACSTVPFLADKRVVLLQEALSKANDRWVQELLEYLPHLPESTQLIFVEQRDLKARHPVLTWAKQHGEQAAIEHFSVPKERSLPTWIVQRTQHHGGQIAPQAASSLAQHIGPQLRLLDQEIQKLLTYRGLEGTITIEDVRRLVPYIESGGVIFDLVDALGQRRPNVAAQQLHLLLDTGDHPLAIFGMIVRQFRLLVQARWVLDRGGTQGAVKEALNQRHDFVVRKICNQARYFDAAQLTRAYQLLLDTDLAIKTGRLAPDAALDLLIAQLTSL